MYEEEKRKEECKNDSCFPVLLCSPQLLDFTVAAVAHSSTRSTRLAVRSTTLAACRSVLPMCPAQLTLYHPGSSAQIHTVEQEAENNREAQGCQGE